MVYLLSGEDAFRASRFLDDAREAFRKTNPHAVEKRFEDTALVDAVRFAEGETLFAQPKIAVFRSSKDFKKEITQAKKALVALAKRDDVLFVMWLEGKKGTVGAAKVQGMTAEIFPRLRGRSLEQWARKTAEAQGAQMSQEALHQLLLAAGEDTRLLYREIEKLATLKPQGIIAPEDVGAMVAGEKTETQFFALIECLLQGKRQGALAAWLQELERGADAIALLAALTSAFRLLVIAYASPSETHHSHILQEANQFWLGKLKALSRGRSEKEIRQGFHTLATIEWQVKTGRREAASALEEFILSWPRASRGATLSDVRHSS